jgi:arylformamidase
MPNAQPLWASLSPEEHEFQYNPQRAFPNFADHQAERAPANASARANLKSYVDISYGEHPLRRVDVYPARELVARGVTTVIANYELCPGSTLDGVVDSALAAVEWTCRSIADYGGDPNRISLSGHSAGAHLCAEALATDWRARGVDPTCFRGAVLISGIFDPEPTIRTTVNAQLNLDPEIAARHNVELRPPLVDCPTWIFAGGREPWQWLDQSYRYAHHLHRHGRDPEVHVLPGWNHFDIIAQYMDEDSPILRAALASAIGTQGR